MSKETLERLAQTRRSYEETDPDAFWESFPEWKKQASETIDSNIIADLKLGPGKVSMIDLGCAGGLRTEEFIEKVRKTYGNVDLRVYGVDYNQKACELASQRKIYENVINGDFTNLGLRDESFDLGICVGPTFQFLLKKMAQGLREFGRILKPQATLYMTVFYEDGSEGQIETFSKPPRYFYIPNKGEFENMARTAGFNVEILGRFVYNESNDPNSGYKILYKLTKAK